MSSNDPLTEQQILEHESGFSFQDNDNDTEINEMMVIEINFGKGKSGDVVVHFGDDPRVLAQNFLKEHGLKDSVLAIVEKHIRTTMDDFIASSAEMRPQTPPLDDIPAESSPPSQSSPPMASPVYQTADTSAFLHHPATDLPPSPAIPSLPNMSFGVSPIPQKRLSKGSPSTPIRRSSSSTDTEELSKHRPGAASASSAEHQSSTVPAKKNRTPKRRSSSPATAAASPISKQPRSPPNREPSLTPKQSQRQQSKAAVAAASSSTGSPTSSMNTSTTEAMYNALRQGSAAAPNGAQSAIRHLQPSSNTLALNRTQGLMSSLDGDAANGMSFRSVAVTHIDKLSERLYRSAAVQREKLDKVRRAEEELIVKELRGSQFKISDASRALTDNIRTISSHEDVTLRLYDDGCKEKEKKKKIAQAHPVPAVLDNWSCARCGTFFVLPLDGGMHGHSSAEPKPRVCETCGWETAAELSFKPTLIGLQLAGTLPYQPTAEELLQRRTQSKSLFHSLYTQTKQLGRKIGRAGSFWQKRDHELPFKPTIPEESNRILQESIKRATEKEGAVAVGTNSSTAPLASGSKAANVGFDASNSLLSVKAGATISTGSYFKHRAVDRLSKSLRPTPRRIVTLPSGETYVVPSTVTASPDKPKPPSPKSADQMDEMVQRLVFEAKERNDRRKALADAFYSTDSTTGDPLWKPKVGPMPPTGGVAVITGADNKEKTRNHKEVIDTLYLKDQRRRERLACAVDEKKKIEDSVKVEKKATALKQSDEILKIALHRSIEEMFRLLYVSTSTSATAGHIGSIEADLRRAQMLSKASEDLENLDSLVLDLSLVQPDMMIPEVTALLVEVCKERDLVGAANANAASSQPDPYYFSNKQNTGSLSGTALPTTYREFCLLVKKCLGRREGVGKRYLYAPKKKSEVAIQMVLAEQSNETFHPKINKASQATMEARGRTGNTRSKGYSVENLLSREAAKVQERVKQARLDKEAKETALLTFRPTLFPLPKGIKPKYWGVPKESVDNENLPPPPAANACLPAPNRSSDCVLPVSSAPPIPPVEIDLNSKPDSAPDCSLEEKETRANGAVRKQSKAAALDITAEGWIEPESDAQ